MKETVNMVNIIGDTAGRVYNLLKQCQYGMTLSELTNALKVDYSILLMAIGWLAREDNVDVLCFAVNSTRVKLKQNNS